MVLVGTSGYNYPEWKGSFYPADLPASKFLPFYASRFPTVEINYTFYRMPTPAIVAGWCGQVPPGFRFTLKAPRRITHDRKLRAAEVADPLAAFLRAAGELGPRLGALLFQLPPTFRKDVGVLNEFLSLLPPGAPAAFEFRHDSWLDDEVFDALRRRRAAVHCRQRDADTPSSRPGPTPTCGSVTRGMARPTSTAGPVSRATSRRGAPTSSSTSSTNEGKGAAFAQMLMERLDR